MLAGPARAQFVPTNPGTYEYLSVLNWLNALTGNINGQFAQTQTGPQTLTFTLDTTITSGFTFNLGGSTPSLTLRSLGLADRTLTFGGDISMASAYGANVNLGDPTANQRLNLALTSGAHVFAIAADNNLALVNTVSDAGGAASLDKRGAGFLFLSGANTYSGGTVIEAGSVFATNATGSATGTGNITIASGAYLAIGKDPSASLGSVAGDIANDGAVVFSRGDAVTYAGNITGAGNVTQSGRGSLTLTGANTYTGGTAVNGGGTLVIGADDTLPTAGDLLVDSRSTLSVAHSQAIGHLQGSGMINLAAARVLTVNGGSFSGTISGDGALAVADSAYFQLNGANTYTGGTSIGNDATLQIGDGESGSLTGDVANHGQLTFYLGGAQAFGGNITGNGSVEFRGGAMYTLTGASTYTGSTRLGGESTTVVVAATDALPAATSLEVASGGTLQLDQDQTLRELNGYDSSGRVVIGATHTLTVNPDVETQSDFGGVISGDGALVKSGAGSLFLYNDNTYTGGTTVSGGTLYLGSGNESYPGGSVQGDITVGEGALVAFNHAFDNTFAGKISGDGAVRTQGFGVMTLTGANTYRGGTTVDYGSTLAIASDTALGDAAGALTLRGGTLRTDAALGTVSRDLVLSDSTGYLDTNGFDSTFSGKITGNTGLTKDGAGVLTLTNPNSDYNGWLTIRGGTVRVGADNALPTTGYTYVDREGTLDVAHDLTLFSLSGTGTISVAASKTLTMGGGYYNIFAGPITGDGALHLANNTGFQLNSDSTYTGGTTIDDGAALSLGYNSETGSITGDVVNNGQLIFGRMGGETFGGVISGTGQVSVTRDTLTLTGANTYGGPTTIFQNATLVAAAAHTLPATTSLSIYENGTLRVDADQTLAQLNSWQDGTQVVLAKGTTLTVDTGEWTGGGAFLGAISGGGAFVKNGAGFQVFAGDNAYTGGTTVNGGQLILGTGYFGSETGSVLGDVALANNAQLWFERSNAYTFAGAITGSGSLYTYGSGTVTLTGHSTYDGQTQVGNGGALSLGAADVLPATTTVVVNGATLDVAHSQTIAGLGGSGSVTLGAGATLTVDTTGGQSSYFGGNVSGAGGLVKNGPDTLTLGGQSTFTGPLTINAGELQFNIFGPAPAFTAAITDSATLTFANGSDYTYAGVLSGAGVLHKDGSGTLTLTANSPFTGSVSITNGTLQLGDGGTAGGLATTSIALNYGAALAVDRSDSFVFPGVVTGNGSFVKDGAGTLTLTGNSSFSGSATVNAGTLVVGVDTALPQVGVTVNDGGTLRLAADTTLASLAGAGVTTIDAEHSLTLAGTSSLGAVVTGAGGLDVRSYLTITADQTYTGPTRLFDYGSLYLGSGGTAGSVAGDILLESAGSRVTFNRSDSFTYAGVISGLGSVGQSGSGNTTLTGLNTYAGTTFIDQGTLTVGAVNALPTAGYVSVNYLATLDVAQNQSVAGLSGPGTVVIEAGRTLTHTGDVDAGGQQFDGLLSGAGALTKTGTDSLNLTHANTYTGGTTLSAGTLTALNATGSATGTGLVTVASGALLQVGGGYNVGSVAGDIVDNGTVAFSRSDATSYGGAISGNGTVAVYSTGGLTFTGTHTYSGGTSLYGGTLTLGNGGLGGSITGDVSLGSGALQFFRSDSVTFAGAISGYGRVGNIGPGTLTLSGDNTYSGDTYITAGRITDGAPGAFSPNSTVLVAPGATLGVNYHETVGGLGNGSTAGGNVAIAAGAALTVDTESYQLFSGTITGPGTFIKQGYGFLTLDGVNAPGATMIGAGTLIIGAGGETGSLAGSVTFTCNANSNGGELQFNHSTAYTFAGDISGPGRVSNMNLGVLTLAGANTYSGATQIYSGGLADGAAGAFSPNSVIYLNAGAPLTVNFNETIAGLMDYSPGYGGAVTLASGATLTVNVASGQFYSASGAITGAGALAKTGPGYLTLGGADAFTGGTTINGGFLIVGNGTTGSLAGDVTFTGNTELYGGELQFNRNDALAFGGSITGPGRVSNFGYGTVSLSGASTYSGGTYLFAGRFADTAANRFSSNSVYYINSPATLAVGYNETIAGLGDYFPVLHFHGGGTEGPLPTIGGGAVTLASGATLTVAMADGYSEFSGIISGDGALAKTGAGILSLTGANTFTGGTAIGPGSTLMLGDGGTGGSIAGNVADAGTLVFNRSDNFTFNGVISGGGSVVQGISNGPLAGTTTLTGVNTYTGGTTINSGKLVAGNASAFGTGPVTLNGGSLGVAQGVTLSTPLSFGPDGGTLSGNGIIGAPFTTGQNVVLSPGNSPGQLTFAGGLTWSSGGSYTFEIVNALGTRPGIDYDTVAVTGGTFAINASALQPFTFRITSLDQNFAAGSLADFNAASSYTWLLATSSSGIQGFASNLFAIDTSAFLNNLGGGTFSVSLGGLNGDTSIFLNFNPASVPEPSTWALLLTGLGAVAFLARRRAGSLRRK